MPNIENIVPKLTTWSSISGPNSKKNTESTSNIEQSQESLFWLKIHLILNNICSQLSKKKFWINPSAASWHLQHEKCRKIRLFQDSILKKWSLMLLVVLAVMMMTMHPRFGTPYRSFPTWDQPWEGCDQPWEGCDQPWEGWDQPWEGWCQPNDAVAGCQPDDFCHPDDGHDDCHPVLITGFQAFHPEFFQGSWIIWQHPTIQLSG